MAVTVLHAGADTLPLRFWSIDDPYLYTVEAELFVNGEKTDAQQLTTGFRAVSYDKDRGLRINGAVQWLRGYAPPMSVRLTAAASSAPSLPVTRRRRASAASGTSA